MPKPESRRSAKSSKKKAAAAQLPPEAALAAAEPYHDYAVVLEAGRFTSHHDRQALHAWFDRCEQSPPEQPLVIHFHGGLVSESSGLASAQTVVEQIYTPAGAQPLCVVWKTGPADVLRSGLGRLLQESLFTKLLDKVIGALRDKIGGATLAATGHSALLSELPSVAAGVEYGNALEFSEAELQQFEADVSDDPDILSELLAIANEDLQAVLAHVAPGDRRFSQHTLLDAAVLLELRQDLAAQGPGAQLASVRGVRFVARVARVLWQVGRRYASRRDHGLHATVVEEIARALYLDVVGQFAWSEMKRYTRTAFEPGSDYGGSALVERLGRLLQQGMSRRVVLVGHSAGAIYICRLLREAHGAFSRISTPAAASFAFDVVFLAPAVRYDEFDETVRTAGPRIGGFRMFCMRDELEREDALIDKPLLSHLYPSSLLYLVSGVCENEPDTPLLGMERFHRYTSPFSAERFPEVQRVRDWLSRRPHRMVLSKTEKTAPIGLRSTAVDHGAFDDGDKKTMGSVKAIVAAGDHAVGVGVLPVIGTAAARPYDGFPAGATGDAEREFHPGLFTGRTLIRVAGGFRHELSQDFHNATGVRLERSDSDAAVSQILAAGDAALLPGTNVFVANLAADQRARIGLGHGGLASLASTHDGGVYTAPERWAYLAEDAGSSLGDFLAGYEAATQQLAATLRDRFRDGAHLDPVPHTVREPAALAPRVAGAGAYARWLHEIGIGDHSTRTGTGVGLCVIDTGIDQYHPDVAASFGAGKRALVCKSFVAGESAHDHHGHGTHCAGLAAGPVETELGFRYGVASEADLYVARVFNAHNRASESDVIRALGWALSMGCAVASMSLVFRTVSPENDAMFDEIVQSVTEEGLLVVAACGNDSDRSRGRRVPVYHPAAYAPSVAVAAVHNGAPANFSNGGSLTNARTPDIAAPGVEITSSVSGPKRYAAMSGTSMATPLVAGVAAMLAQGGGAAALRGMKLREALLGTAQRLAYPVEDVGRGLVQAPV